MRFSRYSIKHRILPETPVGPTPQQADCERKQWFRTQEEAEFGRLFKAYKCQVCDGYHLTSRQREK